MNKYPIFVLSKGRADTKHAKTIAQLVDQNINFTVVVEPQDYQNYHDLLNDYDCAKIIVLPKDDQGIPYVRQFILDLCRGAGIKRYWQLDDNISAFIERKEDKTKEKVRIDYALASVEKIADSYDNVALAGLNYEVTAHWATESFTFNKGIYCAVLTTPETNVNYDLNIEIEDLDFTLSHLKAGYNTLLSNNYVIVKPKTGSTPGGNKMGLYSSQERYENAIRILHEKHSDCTRFHKRRIGWIGIRTSWRNFKREIAKI